ncbi:hypothetical protein HYFRA_00010169 [Hymenoscyphus fraxineus]|uniref:Uncharacterized protein n=1 Tax=Hymenoscyphus fraxineus TaxID=746836 RepID=A0A9N9PRS6_9HELO|nr:hypothetical protein HYFRA_00010169 [Hymenoscyphus fraxineus]
MACLTRNAYAPGAYIIPAMPPEIHKPHMEQPSAPSIIGAEFTIQPGRADGDRTCWPVFHLACTTKCGNPRATDGDEVTPCDVDEAAADFAVAEVEPVCYFLAPDAILGSAVAGSTVAKEKRAVSRASLKRMVEFR